MKPAIFILSFLAFAAILQSFFQTSILKPPSWHPSTFSRLYTLEHASLFITWIAAMLAASQLFQTRKDILHGLGIIAICAIATALSVFFFSGGEYVSFLLGYKHHGMGQFFNRNHAGAFLAMSSLAIAGLCLAPIPLYKHHPEPLEKKLSKQFLLWFLFCLTAAATILTRSRGGMLSLLTGVFSLVLILGIFLPHENRRKAFLAFIISGI
ncbi:MAG: hypothetical protein J5706_01415, partial [Elusimicrobiales bacterium]|nr:hypothetical protein [Elusimicrobiales bacterium]